MSIIHRETVGFYIKTYFFRDNVFTYELVDDSNEHFYMTTEQGSNGASIGVLRIKTVGLYSTFYYPGDNLRDALLNDFHIWNVFSFLNFSNFLVVYNNFKRIPLTFEVSSLNLERIIMSSMVR